jgi:hypothetical protein
MWGKKLQDTRTADAQTRWHNWIGSMPFSDCRQDNRREPWVLAGYPMRFVHCTVVRSLGIRIQVLHLSMYNYYFGKYSRCVRLGLYGS